MQYSTVVAILWIGPLLEDEEILPLLAACGSSKLISQRMAVAEQHGKDRKRKNGENRAS